MAENTHTGTRDMRRTARKGRARPPGAPDGPPLALSSATRKGDSALHHISRTHLHVGCAARPLHAEYFHDHVRIEQMLFDGVPQPENGALKPDLTRPGLGLEFKHADAEKYKI